VLAVPSLCEFYPDICLTTEEKARKNLSQGNALYTLTPLYSHSYTFQPSSGHPQEVSKQYLTCHRHLDKYFVDPAHEISQYTLRMAP
jgi:hypothetical protein